MEIIEITKGNRNKVLILQSEICSIEYINKTKKDIKGVFGCDIANSINDYFLIRNTEFRNRINEYEILKNKYNKLFFDKEYIDSELVEKLKKEQNWLDGVGILFTYTIYTLKNGKSYNTYDYIIEIKDKI